MDDRTTALRKIEAIFHGKGKTASERVHAMHSVALEALALGPRPAEERVVRRVVKAAVVRVDIEQRLGQYRQAKQTRATKVPGKRGRS